MKTNQIRSLPVYSISEAARLLELAPATLKSWVVGRTYPIQGGIGNFEPVIQIADFDDPRLSFNNLVEAYVLRALRTVHSVQLKAVREAIEVAERHHNIDHLLLSYDLRTAAGELFLETYGSLVKLDRSGQLLIKEYFDNYLDRVIWDHDIAVRLFPFIADTDRRIAIDPLISFGRPILFDSGIPTSVIVDRINAGEEIAFLAQDYDISESDIMTAIRYEKAAA